MDYMYYKMDYTAKWIMLQNGLSNQLDYTAILLIGLNCKMGYTANG